MILKSLCLCPTELRDWILNMVWGSLDGTHPLALWRAVCTLARPVYRNRDMYRTKHVSLRSTRTNITGRACDQDQGRSLLAERKEEISPRAHVGAGEAQGGQAAGAPQLLCADASLTPSLETM